MSEQNNYIILNFNMPNYHIDRDDLFKEGNPFHFREKIYALWFYYLRYSHAYWLAHKEAMKIDGGLTEEESKNLPKDFATVQAVYGDFGDIYNHAFHEWWNMKGVTLFQKFRNNRKPSLYKLHNERGHEEKWWTGLKILDARMVQSDLAWWKIGVQLEISSKYKGVSDPDTYKYGDEQPDYHYLEKNICDIVDKTWRIIENSARGKFACTDKIKPDCRTSIDYVATKERLSMIKL